VDSATTIDYIVVSPGILACDFNVLPVMLCQHLPLSIRLRVALDVHVSALPIRDSNLNFVPERVSRVRELLHLTESEFSHASTVDELYELIEAAFLNCGVPKKACSQSHRAGSWWRYVPDDLRREVDRMEAESSAAVSAWLRGDASAPETNELIRLRRELGDISGRAYRIADTRLQEEMAKGFVDATLCWRILKKIRNPVAAVAIDVGTLQSHFTRVFHRRDRPLLHGPDPVLGWGTTATGEFAFDLPFTDAELVRALKELNSGAATGPERIPSKSIKDVFVDEQTRPVLLALMNTCWASGNVPKKWGESELFILYKGKGLRTIADNYRAIALSNDFRRLYERLVGARLSSWSMKHDATGKMQFGFKRGVSTLEAIMVVRTFLCHCSRVLKVPGFSLYVDLRKAFPSMARPKIIQSLCELGVPKNITRSMASLLNGTCSRLRVNGRLTDPFLVTSGTPEGSINSPDLFNLVYRVVLDKLGIEELPADLSRIDPRKVYFVVFADDLTFLSMDLRALEQVANDFKREAWEYDLELNIGKTKWMATLPPEPVDGYVPPELHLKIDGVEVENVDTFVYLGFELDCHMNDEAHAKRLNERLLKAARATGQVMNNMRCSNPASLRKYFITLVASQLYGSIFLDSKDLVWEKAAGVFLKSALNLPNSFPSCVCVAFLRLRSIHVKVLEERMRFLLKVEGKRDSAAYAALLYDREFLMPLGVGINARLGSQLLEQGILPTIDYRVHYSALVQAFESMASTERRSALLTADGRTFWTEISPNGWLSYEFLLVLSQLRFEQVRIVCLFLADSLKWTAVKTAASVCPFCKQKLSSMHFFSCSGQLLNGREWPILISLCQNASWQDVVDVIFEVLKKWVTGTTVFKPLFSLNVLEYVKPHDPNPFRLNIF
jgi:hypothetical protein